MSRRVRRVRLPACRSRNSGGLKPKVFNSLLDGSKPSIESTAVDTAAATYKTGRETKQLFAGPRLSTR